MTNKEILLKAYEEVGTKEVPGSGDNPRIVEYHKFSTRDDLIGMADSVPWCASFICWVLEKVGLKSTNSKRARSFEDLGEHVSIEDFLPGDILVFYRNGLASGQGHVTIGLKITKSCFGDKAYCLGGNQSDAVNVTKYPLNKLTAIRRVSNTIIYSDQEVLELKQTVMKILKNQEIKSGGSVT